MRQFLTLRYWAALLVLFVMFLTLYLWLGRSEATTIVEDVSPHRVDLIALTSTVRSDEPWSVGDGHVTGNATAVLADGRILSITDGTAATSSCLFPEALNACVLLADTLGDGIVWFALVPAPPDGATDLELPPIAELLDGVTYARLTNGWEVPLLDKVRRRCEEETPNLTSFVQRFAGAHTTIVDLERAQVSAVVCDA